MTVSPFLSILLFSLINNLFHCLLIVFDVSRYKCVHDNNEVDRIDVDIKKFQFVKLPKHYLVDDVSIVPETQ